MDISICRIDPVKKKFYFAGANHSFYMVDNNGFQKIESQINSINGIFGINTEEKITTNEFTLEKDKMIYLSTDGYSDQIGEKTIKKFLSSFRPEAAK